MPVREECACDSRQTNHTGHLRTATSNHWASNSSSIQYKMCCCVFSLCWKSIGWGHYTANKSFSYQSRYHTTVARWYYYYPYIDIARCSAKGIQQKCVAIFDAKKMQFDQIKMLYRLFYNRFIYHNFHRISITDRFKCIPAQFYMAATSSYSAIRTLGTSRKIGKTESLGAFIHIEPCGPCCMWAMRSPL